MITLYQVHRYHPGIPIGIYDTSRCVCVRGGGGYTLYRCEGGGYLGSGVGTTPADNTPGSLPV